MRDFYCLYCVRCLFLILTIIYSHIILYFQKLLYIFPLLYIWNDTKNLFVSRKILKQSTYSEWRRLNKWTQLFITENNHVATSWSIGSRAVLFMLKPPRESNQICIIYIQTLLNHRNLGNRTKNLETIQYRVLQLVLRWELPFSSGDQTCARPLNHPFSEIRWRNRRLFRITLFFFSLDIRLKIKTFQLSINFMYYFFNFV